MRFFNTIFLSVNWQTKKSEWLASNRFSWTGLTLDCLLELPLENARYLVCLLFPFIVKHFKQKLCEFTRIELLIPLKQVVKPPECLL